MASLADELYRSLIYRIGYLESELTELRAGLGTSRRGLSHAVQVTSEFPAWIKTIVQDEWARSEGDPEGRTSLVYQYLLQVSDTTEFVDDWFRPAQSQRVPVQLLRGVERSCEALGLRDRQAVLAPGTPTNFETYVPDLVSELFPRIPPHRRPSFPGVHFALMRVPILEGSEAFWMPIVCGHEVAHLALATSPAIGLSLARLVDLRQFSNTDIPVDASQRTRRMAMLPVVSSWVEEILCDLYTAQSFGPAGVAALFEFLSHVGAIDKATDTHPPGWLRAFIVNSYVGTPHTASLRRVMRPWRELAARRNRQPMPQWAEILTDNLLSLEEDFRDRIDEWPHYDWRGRETTSINWAIRELRKRIPPRQQTITAEPNELLDPDIVNAAWAQRCSQPLSDGGIEEARLTSRLAAKSLDTLEFLRSWETAVQSLPVNESQGLTFYEPLTAGRPQSELGGILSDGEILRRLADRSVRGLVVTPLQKMAIGGGGVDVRLGAKFITFRRSGTASFHPLGRDDPRSMQTLIEKGWGESFVLHPNELVLSSTLEYIALPDDIAAQVITRSSLGRLGLITATAIVVNPGFRGCLTLELVNVGEVPLHVLPGSRIAQIVLFNVSPRAWVVPSRYDCPTGPEFSRLRADRDLRVLERLQHAATEVTGTRPK